MAIKESSRLNSPSSKLEFCYADVINSVTSPSEDFRYVNGKEEAGDCAIGNESHSKEMDATYAIGGLSWSLTKGHKMEDYLLFYIGSENSAFANVLLTFNSCELGSALCLLSTFILLFTKSSSHD